MINVCAFTSIIDGVRNESSDDFGESYDDQANDGVKNNIFGLFDLAGITTRNNIGNTTINDKDSSNETDDTNNPLDDASYHESRVGDTIRSGTVCRKVSAKCDTDSVHNYCCPHDDSKASEGMSQSFLAASYFARIAARHGVEIAAIDNITEY